MAGTSTTAASLDALFTPRSIAVVGASASPEKAGYRMMAALAGFPGRLYPVNPRAGEINGMAAFPRVSALPEAVDLAVLTVPAPAVPAAARECAAAGIGAAVVCAGGFAESGPEGAALQEELREIAESSGMRLLGPNTSGFVNPAAGVHAVFLSTARVWQPGGIGIVAQSGGVNGVLAFVAHERDIGVRLAVGLGNAVDVGFADVLDYLADDEGTRAIALHVEGVPDGRALMEAVGRAADRKPVVALVLGRTDVDEFARSHTGALTSGWKLTRAALTQAGAVVAEDTTELIDAAFTLGLARLAPTPRPGVGVVTAQAGPGLLIADALRAGGVTLPPLAEHTEQRLAELLPPLTYQRNPVDTGRPDITFGDVVAAVAADPGIDAVVVNGVQEPGALDMAEAIPQALRGSDVPAVCVTAAPRHEMRRVVEALAGAGVPVLPTPERGARATVALVADARASHRRGAPRSVPAPRGRAAGFDGVTFDEHRAKQLLAAYGIAVPDGIACATREEAHEALRRLRAPVAVKVLDPSVSHKTDIGGVRLGVANAVALDAALDAVDEAVVRTGPYLVEAMAPDGVELIVGGRRDGVFGTVLLLGLGGTAVEALDCTVLRVAPITPLDAEEMLEELPAGGLLAGHRGLPAVDPQELAGVLCTIADVLEAHPEIGELEVNPLRVTSAGLVALDALVVPADAKHPRP